MLSETSSNFGETLKFYRPRVGLTIQAVLSEKDRDPTVNIEMAPGVDKQIKWDEKTTLQVTRTELPRVCACCLRMIRTVEYQYHGPKKNRSYKFYWKDDKHLTVEVNAPKVHLFMSFTGDEAFWLAEFLLDRLHKNCHAMTKSDLMNLLKRTVAVG